MGASPCPAPLRGQRQPVCWLEAGCLNKGALCTMSRGTPGCSAEAQCWPMTSALSPREGIPSTPILAPRKCQLQSLSTWLEAFTALQSQEHKSPQAQEHTHVCPHVSPCRPTLRTQEDGSPALPSDTQMCKLAPSIPTFQGYSDPGCTHTCDTNTLRAADATPLVASLLSFNSACRR